MVRTVEQIVRKFDRDMARLLRETNTPAKARKVLLRAGIIVKHPKSPGGVRLAKRFR